MRTLEHLKKQLEPYGAAEFIYYTDVGCLAWHYSTGRNLEPIFIEAAEKGNGNGRELYRRMILSELRNNRRPYHSVFIYRLSSNTEAERFYKKMGWAEINLGKCIYAGDDTVLMWITWEDFMAELGVNEHSLCRNESDR